MSTMFKLVSNDFIKGLVVAVLTAVLTAIAQLLQVSGFSSFDWNQILSVAITAGVAYLAKNYLSDENGKVLGSIG